MDAASFGAVVVAALDELPAEFARYLENVEILVQYRPLREHRRAAGIRPWQALYGLYQGVPLTDRTGDMLIAPDTITIFREPLTRDFLTRSELRAQIRRTVLHEIAHVFGISDERLDELDAY